MILRIRQIRARRWLLKSHMFRRWSRWRPYSVPLVTYQSQQGFLKGILPGPRESRGWGLVPAPKLVTQGYQCAVLLALQTVGCSQVRKV